MYILRMASIAEDFEPLFVADVQKKGADNTNIIGAFFCFLGGHQVTLVT